MTQDVSPFHGIPDCIVMVARPLGRSMLLVHDMYRYTMTEIFLADLSTLTRQVYPPSMPRVLDKLGGQQQTEGRSRSSTFVRVIAEYYPTLTFEPVRSEGRLVAKRRQPVLVAERLAVEIPTAEHGVVQTKFHGVPDLAVELMVEQPFARHHGRD